MDVSTFEPHEARALELQIGKARVAIGIEHVDRIVETVCTAIPLAHPLVRGVALDDARPIVCVSLTSRSSATPSEPVTAVCLRIAGGATWALCADRVLGVVPLVGRAPAIDARLPRWLSRVQGADGRVLAGLDPIQMAHDIGGPA